MKSNDTEIGIFSRDVNRRRFLGGVAAAAGASCMGVPMAAAQSGGRVEVVMLNAALNGSLRTSIEEAIDAKISDVPWLNTTDAVSRLLAPGGTSRYDLMLAIPDFAGPPILGANPGDEKVKALDLSKIPNLVHLADFFRKDIVSRDGDSFIVPIYWGYDSVLYDTTQLPEDDPFTQSWAPLFEDKYKGRIAWLDAAHQMFMAAGLHMGIEDPTNMDKAQINEVAQFLASRKKNVRTIYSSIAEGTNLLATGEVVCLYGPVPMRADLQRKGFNITNAWPKEGVLNLIHAAFIPKDAPNPEGAYGMINAMLGEAYASNLSAESGFLSCSNLGASNLTPEERKRLGYGVMDGTTKAYRLAFPPNIDAMIEGWTKVKSS